MIPWALYSDLLGKPYERHGRGPAAYDCVGLLLEVQRRLGRELPDYPSRASRVAGILGEWERVPAPAPGDSILFRSTSPRWHVAVAIGSDSFIHAKEEAGVVVDSLTSPLYARRIEGFYRWASGQSASLK